MCTGIYDVGKDHARSAEHVVLKRDIVIYGHVILNPDVVAKNSATANKDVLPQSAALADPCPVADVNPVPDARACAYDNPRLRLDG